MLCGTEHIRSTETEQRHVGKDDEDIAKVGDGPQVAQVNARQRAGNAKGCNKDAQQADGIDKGSLIADAVSRNFWEADHADEAGKSKETETKSDTATTSIIQAGSITTITCVAIAGVTVASIVFGYKKVKEYNF